MLAPAPAPSVLAPAAPARAAAAPAHAAAPASPAPASASPAAATPPETTAAGGAAGKALAFIEPKDSDAPSAEGRLDTGRLFFDLSAARSDAAVVPAPGGLWNRIKNRLSAGEAAPSWPGKAGDAVRVGGIKTELTRRIGGGASALWMGGQDRYSVKILPPRAMDASGFRDEARLLRAAARTDIPVARLLAVSLDGTVLVKEYIDGSDASDILARGAFSRPQAQGWAELAAKLIKNGATADLAGGNLVWQHWHTRWVIMNGNGLTDGSPREVLTRLLAPDVRARSGMNAAEFLAELRGRLGPDSTPWRKTLAALRSTPALAEPLAALEARDAALPPAPRVQFGPSSKNPGGLDDTVVTYAEAVRRLGWDPLRAKSATYLHGDDPGKLNTTVLSVESPDKTPLVVKKAEWRIIRNEVALRRLARRFFGLSFRVPASLAVNRGGDSFMVMQKVDAGGYYYETPLNPEQRVAAAILIHTFGVTDVNPGNVLSARDGGLPWLIDFEQALGRVEPVAGRVPDEGIALEMPWLTRRKVNRVEDFQPAVRAWRALFRSPEAQAAVAGDLRASGFSSEETVRLLAIFQANAADLDWTLQNDVDFVNQFAERVSRD
jgi:hypothetical protein